MPTDLLDDRGAASMATAMMSSHHAFRRDLRCFAEALTARDPSRADAVAEEWAKYRGALHGHHTVEDTAMFPDLRARLPEHAADFDVLDAHHRAIDPLLDHPLSLELVRELQRVLDEHLELEERVVIPHLRDAREFPPPPTEEALAMYADGFAWSTAGLAPSVQQALDAMLPPALVARLPQARAAFDERCVRVWGRPHAGASTTSVPR